MTCWGRIPLIGIVLLLPALRARAAVQADSTSGGNDEAKAFVRWKLWGEIYDESTRFQKLQNNLISTTHIRQGIRLYWTPTVYTEAYGMVRYGKDMNRDFWNNRFEAGVGLRTRFFEKVFLAFYLENLRVTYRSVPEEYPQPERRQLRDWRAGAIFWYGWDRWFSPEHWIAFPLIAWGEAYSELNYFHSERDNVFWYLQTRSGFHLVRVWQSEIDGYGVLYLLKDVNRDFWNNKAEWGPGIWFKPWVELSLQIYAEWLTCAYFGIEGRDPNPYAQRYRDRRVGVLFWIGW